MIDKTKLEDILGEVSSLATAVSMAANSLDNTRHVCALDTLADRIVSLIEDARCIIDTMGAQP